MTDTTMPAAGTGESAADAEAKMAEAMKQPESEPTPASESVDISALVKKLDAAEAAYKGLQTKYNKLFEEKNGIATEAETLKNQMTEMERGMTTTNEQTVELQKQIDELTAARDALKADFTKSESQLALSRLIDSEFPYLRGMAGNLTPRETEEATRQMLEGMNAAVKSQIDTRLADVVGDYNSGGNMQRGGGNAMSPEQLYKEMVSKAGTPEYAALSEKYYELVNKDPAKYGVPMPPTDALSDFDNTLI